MVAVYVNSRRLAPSTSNILMVGFQLEGQNRKIDRKIDRNKNRKKNRKIDRNKDREKDIKKKTIGVAGLIVNNTVFLQLRKNLIVALEVNIYLNAANGESYIAIYPQVQLNLLTIFEIQMGIGLVFTKTKFVPQLIHRAILSKPEGL